MPTRAVPRAKAPGTTRPALTEAEILRVALEIIEERGIDGLTMRHLSSRLGVALGATYHHVQNKHALLVLVARSRFARIDLPIDGDDGDWAAQLRSVLLDVTDVFTGQAELAAYVLGHFDDMAPTELIVAMHAVLARAGFAEEAIDDALATLFFYVGGTLVGGFTTMGGGDAQRRELRARFERGLDVILTGIRASLAPIA